MFFCPTILWSTLPSHGDRWRQQNLSFFWSSPRVTMRPHAIDWSIEILQTQIDLYNYLHILALCNVWQHLNTCASRIMQVYASHSIALNKWRLKILAHVSLNANCFIFTSGCLLLFTFNYMLLYSSKVLLYYFTVNSRGTVYALCQHVIYVSLPVTINRS